MIDHASAFREWFRVPPAAVRILVALHDAGGETLSFPDLITASGQTANGVNLSIKFLRAAMDPLSIMNVSGVGYRLAEIGARDCEAALADAARMERAA